MAQNTNLNVTPYYDDFDKAKNFYRVLFRPGFPIQARELTQTQSILQNQIENVGSHLFKDCYWWISLNNTQTMFFSIQCIY